MDDIGVPIARTIETPSLPSFEEAMRVWLRIGCLSFGGPAGQIAMLHRAVVDERNWVSDRRFLHALNFCTLLPGPEAQQLATYLGWLMHGAKGGFAAGLLFIVPGALVMLALSVIYATSGTVPLIAALFFGLKSAVLVLVVEAVLRIGRRALKGPLAWTLAAIAFVALFFFGVPFPAVVLTAALIGYGLPGHFAGGAHGKPKDGPPALLDAVLDADPHRAARMARGGRRAGIAAAACWLIPVALLLPAGGVYADIAWFFSKMAVVTFGGAYAVLAYAAQDAVQSYRWLSAPEMLTGPRPCRNHTRPADPGAAIRRLPGGLPCHWSAFRHSRRGRRLDPDAVGDLHALLCLRVPGCAAGRALAGQSRPVRRAGRGHCGRGGRDRQPRGLVRTACAVPPDCASA